MHTTFIPTLLYMILITLCWVGKLLVLPVASILSRGAVVEKPHHLTAGVFLFIAAVFGVISTGVDTLGNKTIESRLSTQESKPVLRQSRNKSGMHRPKIGANLEVPPIRRQGYQHAGGLYNAEVSVCKCNATVQ
ncbi:hypothetical protein ES703_105792 [subsurface metagenome]